MPEKVTMHLPVLALGARRLGCLGRDLRLWMDRSQGKIAEDIADLITQTILQFPNNGVRLKTVRALEISILHKDNWSIWGTLNVIPISDLRFEARDL
jgi:hypothetical protein